MKKAEIDINNLPLINRRLYEFAMKTSGSIYAFSKNIGLSQPRINSLFHISEKTGKYPIIQSDILEAILNKYEFNTNWLYTGKGDMLKNISEISGVENSMKLPEVPEINKNDLGVVPSLLSLIKEQGQTLKEIALSKDKRNQEEHELLVKGIQRLEEILGSQEKQLQALYKIINDFISQNNIPGQKKAM